MPQKRRGNGEGTIYFNGRYYAAQINVNGKRKTVYGHTKKDAALKLNNLKLKQNLSSYKSEMNFTVDGWALYWLHNFKKPYILDSTYDRYEKIVKKHIIKPFKDILLINFNTFMIQEYFNKLKYSNLSEGYIGLIFKRMNEMLEKALYLDIIKKNPCKYTVISKNKKNNAILPLTLYEQKLLVKYLKEAKYGNFFMFLLSTGLRLGEALALTWEDFSKDMNSFYITKTTSTVNGNIVIHEKPKTQSSIRTVYLNKTSKNIIDYQYKINSNKNKNNLVFFSDKYTYINSSSLRYILSSTCKKAGIRNITIHSLRHTFATRALENNINIKVLSAMLGHSDIKLTLNTYAHVLNDFKKETELKFDIFDL